jgi:hypothetical protein
LIYSVMVASVLTAGLVSVHAQQNCEELKDLKLDHGTIVSATSHEPAPLKFPPSLPIKAPALTIPGHCEVRVVARPSSDSEITFLLWLPARDVWNAKYMQNGSGG